MDLFEKSDANDCKSACISILDYHCENPSRCCLGCRRSKKCELSVKYAHDALCGVMGLSDDIDNSKWKALRSWQEQYHSMHPNPAIYPTSRKPNG